MLNGLDLFSGIGGLSIALEEWVRPIAYCEIDSYCQSVLLSRIHRRELRDAPIWDDIRTYPVRDLCTEIDIIYGGFPCQDISVAGRGKGLEGERSGLFFEIMRLAKEIKPKFIFLENVPAITTRGGLDVVRTIVEMGYDCRWCVISAASVGALHRRERWFLLAHSTSLRFSEGASERIHSERKTVFNEKPSDSCGKISNPKGKNRSGLPERKESQQPLIGFNSSNVPRSEIPNPICSGLEGQGDRAGCASPQESMSSGVSSQERVLNYWENTQPPVCGVAHGVPHRVDRIRALGNSVVPSQAKEAFKILMGF